MQKSFFSKQTQINSIRSKGNSSYLSFHYYRIQTAHKNARSQAAGKL